MSSKWQFCLKETLSYTKVVFRENKLHCHWSQKECRWEDTHLPANIEPLCHNGELQVFVDSFCYLWILPRGQIQIFKKLQKNYTEFCPAPHPQVSKECTLGEIFDIYNVSCCLAIAFLFKYSLAVLCKGKQIMALFLNYCFWSTTLFRRGCGEREEIFLQERSTNKIVLLSSNQKTL